MATNDKGSLGVLMLGDEDVSPPPPPDKLNYPAWFAYPVIERKVPGAFSREVVGGNRDLAGVFAETAKELEKDGAKAITVDCGFSIIYQQAIADAVSIPVVTSSLLQLPFVSKMVPAGGRLGLMIFDTTKLTPYHFECAGFEEGSVPLGIVGIEGTKTWQHWYIEDPTTTFYDDVEKVTMEAARKLIKDYPDVTHIVMECSGFPRCAPQIRQETGRPVFDWVTLCNYAMGAV